MIMRKSALRRSGLILVGGLLLIALLIVLFGPISPVGAAEPALEACGDGVCDPTQENNDLCPADCQCTDNGMVDPGEGCGCRDLVCEDEDVSTACGTPCGFRGACPEGLTCHNEVCWSPASCGPGPEAEEGENCDPVFVGCSGQKNVGWAQNPCTGKLFRIYAPECD